MTSTADKGVTLTHRIPDFDFSGLTKDWFQNNLAISSLLAVFSITATEAEAFFIRNIAELLPDIKDPQLKKEVQLFIKQEAAHSQVHGKLNRHLGDLGYPVDEASQKLKSALERIDIEDGYDSLSTGQVAKRAGVSIGSLYQYFPNKEAIIAELIRKLVNDATILVSGKVDLLLDQPLETATLSMITAVVDLCEKHGDLGRELIVAAQQMGVMPGLRMVEERISEAGRRYLMRHRSEINVQDIDQAIFVTFNAGVFVIFRSVFAPPSFMTREQVIDELYRMIIGHLTRTWKSPPSSSNERNSVE